MNRWTLGLGLFTAGVLFSACGVSQMPPGGPTAPAAPAQRADGAAKRAQQLYVSTIDGGSVVVYSAAMSPQLLQTITDGVPRPGGIWVDGHGVLYAVNVPDSSYQTSLPAYKPGATVPFRTITDGIVNCGNVAVDAKGNVYVTGVNNATGAPFLEIYPKGRLSPSETLTIPHKGLAGIGGLAFDSSGALLVGEGIFESVGAVHRLPPGSQTFTNLKLHDINGGAIVVDGSGNLYVGGTKSIAIFPPNATKPSRVIKISGTGVSALALDAAGELYVGMNETVSVYAPGAKKPANTFTIPGHVGGISVSP
ncbi:MAG: hypothetical protein WB615_16665 [Candidatus Tumulicola sp.]